KHRLCGRLDLARQGFGELGLRGNDSLLGTTILPYAPANPCGEHYDKNSKNSGNRAAPDPQAGERALEDRGRRRIGQAAFTQRTTALVQDSVGDLRTLAFIDAAKPRLEADVATNRVLFAQRHSL